MPRAHWVDYLNKHFEFDIRNLDPFIGGQPPGTFATALVENLDLWCEITQLSAEKTR